MDFVINAVLQFGQHYGKPFPEGVNFWVAVGTLLSALATVFLAIVTVLSVKDAGRLIHDEDARHQQGTAPILRLEAQPADGEWMRGFNIRNVGLGPAQEVHVALRGEMHGTDGKVYSVDYSQRRSIFATTDNWHISTDERGFEPVKAFRLDGTRVVAAISYMDMFANTYMTISQDVLEEAETLWLRPNNLYPVRTKMEAYLDKYAHDDVLDHLTATRPVATT
jgi:hypothetical protein